MDEMLEQLHLPMVRSMSATSFGSFPMMGNRQDVQMDAPLLPVALPDFAQELMLPPLARSMDIGSVSSFGSFQLPAAALKPNDLMLGANLGLLPELVIDPAFNSMNSMPGSGKTSATKA